MVEIALPEPVLFGELDQLAGGGGGALFGRDGIGLEGCVDVTSIEPRCHAEAPPEPWILRLDGRISLDQLDSLGDALLLGEQLDRHAGERTARGSERDRPERRGERVVLAIPNVTKALGEPGPGGGVLGRGPDTPLIEGSEGAVRRAQEIEITL